MKIQVQVEELETDHPLTKKLKITLPPDVVEKGLRTLARQLTRARPIPGFRPGKAPYKVVEQRYGRKALLERFIEANLGEILTRGLEEAGIKVADLAIAPEILDISYDPPSVTIAVALPPRVKLGDYKSIRVEYKEPEPVTDQDVERELRNLFLREGRTESVDGPVQEDDTVQIEITAKVKDNVIISGEKLFISPGDELYLPGLTSALLGMKVGEVKTFTLPIPENHPWREYGKEAEITLHVLEIQRFYLPELTPELLARYIPGASNEEEAREIIRKELETQRKEEAEREYEDKVYKILEEQSSVEISPLLIKHTARNIRESEERYLQTLGLSPQESHRILHEEIRNERLLKKAEQLIREKEILSAVAQDANLSVDSEEIQRYLVEFALINNISTIEVAKQFTENSQFAQEIVARALLRQARRYLADIARGRLELEEESPPQEGGETKPESEAVSEEERLSAAGEETPTSPAAEEAPVTEPASSEESEEGNHE